MSANESHAAAAHSAAEQATAKSSAPSDRPSRWPSLKTQRLVILPLTITWQAHVESLNDKEHMRFSEQRRFAHTKDTQREFILQANRNRILLDLQRQEAIVSSIGSMTCYTDEFNKVVDLGLMIIPRECGKGYGTEAWRAVMHRWLEWGYKVEGGCMADNYNMRDLMVGCDMMYEGVRNGHYLLDDGTRSDWVLYGRAPIKGSTT